jgi:hypothetical protein
MLPMTHLLHLANAVINRNLEHRYLVPGIVGSSTVLGIAFGALTIVHSLFAIWREWWKGAPIGVWKLRRKMAWICMDLLFIALW